MHTSTNSFSSSVVEMTTGLSRSTESSLKRTKRKAPPPPASPGVVVQDETFLDRGKRGFTEFIRTVLNWLELKPLSRYCISGVVSYIRELLENSILRQVFFWDVGDLVPLSPGLRP